MNRLAKNLAGSSAPRILHQRSLVCGGHARFQAALVACRSYASKPPPRHGTSAAARSVDDEPVLDDVKASFSAHTPKESPDVQDKEVEVQEKSKVTKVGKTTASGSSGFTEFPNLMQYDPLMDSREVLEFAPTKKNPYGGRVVIRNDTSSMFSEEAAAVGIDYNDPEHTYEVTDSKEEQLSSTENLPLTPSELSKLYRFPIYSRRITQQTGKGKIHRIYTMMIVGNGNGLIGLGEGKDEDVPRSQSKAFSQAVRNMDYVERFEDRTVWTEMTTKLGATQIILRPRPVGFGLRCNPNLHQVLKAAGIKDISAKVWGSRNRINVVKAAFRMLQGGNAPLGMGDGIGGKGRRLNEGSGARSMFEVERERGRKLIPLRT